MQQIKNYVNGQWIEPENDGWLDVENPSTGEVFAQVALSTAAEMNRAVDAASAAFESWGDTPVSRRCEFMFRLADCFE